MQGRIGIVIPAYNAERTLARTVQSILCQTLNNFELIIVDDGSSDATFAIGAELAEQDSRVSILKRQNMGVSAARNAGYAKLPDTVEHVMFLDADDIVEQEALATLSAFLDQNTMVLAVYGQARAIDMEDRLLNGGLIHRGVRRTFRGGKVSSTENIGPISLQNVLNDNPVTTPGQLLIRRTALIGNSPFDESLRSSEDWDLIFRLVGSGPVHGLALPTLRYRLHTGNSTRRVGRMRMSGLRMRLKWFGQLDWSMSFELIGAYLGRARCRWRNSLRS
jgi:glycosyltransferase involved in cell wall biosynthesis